MSRSPHLSLQSFCCLGFLPLALVGRAWLLTPSVCWSSQAASGDPLPGHWPPTWEGVTGTSGLSACWAPSPSQVCPSFPPRTALSCTAVLPTARAPLGMTGPLPPTHQALPHLDPLKCSSLTNGLAEGGMAPAVPAPALWWMPRLSWAPWCRLPPRSHAASLLGIVVPSPCPGTMVPPPFWASWAVRAPLLASYPRGWCCSLWRGQPGHWATCACRVAAPWGSAWASFRKLFLATLSGVRGWQQRGGRTWNPSVLGSSEGGAGSRPSGCVRAGRAPPLLPVSRRSQAGAA